MADSSVGGQGTCLLQAEKNMAWEAQQQQAQAQAQLNALQSQQGTGPCKLLVANINIRIEVGKPCWANTWWQVLVGMRSSLMQCNGAFPNVPASAQARV